MGSCCIYTGVCGVECSGKDTEVDINSCKVAREIDKLIDRIQNLKREKEKYYQMTLDDEIQIDELFRENAKLKKENEVLQTSLEMIKNTEGQAHIKAIELTKKLEKIKEVVKCSKETMCDNCPMCEWCEELCVNDENLQDIILQIIEGAEDD